MSNKYLHFSGGKPANAETAAVLAEPKSGWDVLREQSAMKPNCAIFIPDNDHGIVSTNYGWQGLVALLREYKNNPAAVQFIADMME